MSNYFNSSEQFHEVHSTSTREMESSSDNILPGIQSNLQPTAPEYYPLNTNQGAIRKKHLRQHQDFRGGNAKSKFGKSSHVSNLKPTAQEFYPGNSNSGVKRFQEKKPHWKDRNPRYNTNWRSSSYEYDTGQETTNFGRSNNTKYTGNYEGYGYKGSHSNSDFHGKYERNEETYGNNKTVNSSPVHPKYERNANENTGTASNGYKPKFQYERRNGYVTKSFGRSKQGEKNYQNFNGNGSSDKFTGNFSGRTEFYNNEVKRKDKWYVNNTNTNVSTAGQRERLIEMINSRVLECMVCCEKIKRIDKIWSCFQCYHIIHINCIIAWAESSKVEENWRCPACQNVYTEVPNQYTCYCGKIVDPKLNPNIIAHGCDNMCLRKGKNCDHRCSILCHPGPCPECSVMVSKPCGCGMTQQVVKCSSDVKITCHSSCNKILNCGVHKCLEKCHTSPCSPCKEFIIQECYCEKTGRKVPCDAEHCGKINFICEDTCGKLLPCGNHKCKKQCHPGPCSPCESDINIIKNCFCGKTPLESKRTSCLDPIPCCDNKCNKPLICGPPSMPHVCKEKCHAGKCPPCPLTTVIRCRCGHMDKEMACQKLTTKADDARCEKKCTKKRLCGKHTCKQRCCIEIEHVCPLPCNHLLSCGLHKCELTCHSGRCPPCMETSFEELYCECGASVLYPPIPCGTKRPACKKLCTKSRSCGHPVNHECHPGPCPPCFILSKQWCYGNHEQRAAIPCHQNSFSCGLPCGQPMPCGRHTCIKSCHDDSCPLPCTQPCTVPRVLCGHPCNKPCHNPPCPDSTCKQMVPVTCPCGLQKSSKICMDLTEEFRNLEMAQLKDKLGNLSLNTSFDVTDIMVKKPSVLKILECNDECKILERNRRLAIGLQIQNPDLSQKLTPRYSDFLKQWAKKDSKFCQRIHDKLSELVQLAKQSKQKSRSYSFESMNRDKRTFIHEYCEYFGVESAAYDAEPNRNVVATAIRDKSWLPSMSLLEVLQRENGQRKVPGPVLGYGTTGESEAVSLKVLTSAQKM